MLMYCNGIFVTDHASLEASNWNMPTLRKIQINSLKLQLDFILFYNQFPSLFIGSNSFSHSWNKNHGMFYPDVYIGGLNIHVI